MDIEALLDTSKCQQILYLTDLRSHEGKVSKIVGMTIEATGLICSIGDICKVMIKNKKEPLICEVVGIAEKKAFLMPYQEIDNIGYGCAVINTGEKLTVCASNSLIGRTVDALGNPIDQGAPITDGQPISIEGETANPLQRPPISEVMELGVKSLDGLLTLGKGQRIGIFAGSGVGKSTLMGMIARNVQADVNVIALVGERGREVVEFINRDLGPAGLSRSVLVVATSDQPAMMRYKCAQTATAIAEFFQKQGKHVILMMDSLTRFAMTQREIGLNTGELPIARGYTPSIYSALPKLLERSGNFEKGSITGIYTVLVEGDDTNEPVADTVRGIIDGHIILSRKIAAQNHYPSIDILNSVSRLMNNIVSSQQRAAANQLRSLMALYRENEDLITIGAYKQGSDPKIDYAIGHMDKINQFLVQEVDEAYSFSDTVNLMEQAVQ